MAAVNVVAKINSKEDRGSTQPNMVQLRLAAAGDAADFAANLNRIFAGEVASIDQWLDHDYSVPYPAGNGKTLRFALRDAASRTHIFYLPDIKAGTDIDALCEALITAGIRLPKYDSVAIVCNAYRMGSSERQQSAD